MKTKTQKTMNNYSSISKDELATRVEILRKETEGLRKRMLKDFSILEKKYLELDDILYEVSKRQLEVGKTK